MDIILLLLTKLLQQQKEAWSLELFSYGYISTDISYFLTFYLKYIPYPRH